MKIFLIGLNKTQEVSYHDQKQDDNTPSFSMACFRGMMQHCQGVLITPAQPTVRMQLPNVSRHLRQHS